MVATCQNGEFNFLGLPSKFLTENKESKDSCNFCHEDRSRCALARTRGQAKKESEEDAIELEEQEQEAREAKEGKADETIKGNPMLNWLGKINRKLSLDLHSANLLDPHYENKSDRVLSKRLICIGPEPSSAFHSSSVPAAIWLHGTWHEKK